MIEKPALNNNIQDLYIKNCYRYLSFGTILCKLMLSDKDEVSWSFKLIDLMRGVDANYKK